MPKASVIIPVYKAENFVADTIRSVLAQTYTDFEILIVDDGSPDKSVEVCRQFDDPRIRIIQQPNRGLPGARNTGIRSAVGEYVALLDADDLWAPEKLEKHIQHLDSSPEVGISFSYSAFIDEFGEPTGLVQKPKKLQNIEASYILCRNPIGNGSSPVMRRETLNSIEFYDDVHGQTEPCYFDERLRHKSADATDVECWLRTALKTSWKIEGIPEVLTFYRVNSGGLSANALKQLEALDRVIEKTRSYASEVIGECEHRARAYHLRYIARRAVTLRDGTMAVQMLHQALGSNWQIILEEPRRSLVTAIAAYLLWLLPKNLYVWVEGSALSAIQTVKGLKQQLQASQG